MLLSPTSRVNSADNFTAHSGTLAGHRDARAFEKGTSTKKRRLSDLEGEEKGNVSKVTCYVVQ